MHVVVWTSKGQRYATPSAWVIEVVPMVLSRPLPESDEWLTGLFDFHGELLPLIDSARLLGHDASTIRMSSRVLVLLASEQAENDARRVGLIVEQVLGSEHLDFEGDAACRPPASSGIDFLGPVAMTQTSTVQLTLPACLPRWLN